ncbi:DNA-directed RNA polymerase subunit epsilon [Bacillus sp. CRN 9]|uniref:DNA-dependent RNA polymerase subunit epsilon n=1 Tax=Cytobacillus horneckiae TaxID=549687 RepID=UPI001561B157|nr:DNA-dependent RNA polymerase auxiliary subunit epsilon family protein [Bacillus sp. CRN 9]
MIFKVYYQESAKEVPVREKTQTVYVEGVSERDVRTKLKNRPFNIEFVTAVDGDFLEYEKQNEDYKVLEIE